MNYALLGQIPSQDNGLSCDPRRKEFWSLLNSSAEVSIITEATQMARLIWVRLLCSILLSASIVVAQSHRRDNPTVKETLRWMQTSLESGSGDYWVGHEVRSLRLDDFVGCRVHFSASTHQEPFANGEPAPDKKPTRIDYFFELGDINPANIAFSKGPHSSTEVPSFITIRTRNDEKKIRSRYSWQPEASAKPDDTFVIFAVEAFGSDNDYVVRFAKAFEHAVEGCGGKPSLFADADGQNEQRRPAPSSVAAQSASPRKDIPSIAKAANGSIVSIVMSDDKGKPIAQGTGFVVTKDGLIVTNYHVIAEGSSAVAKLPDGAIYILEGVVATDKARDVAVVKATGQNFRTLVLGNSDRVEVGQEVVAIGNPLSLESTVSNGIVSGMRTAEELGGKFLQVTAPISPGSSGGPLFNMAGEVIGITTLYLKGGENLNFAIPINDAKRLLVSQHEKNGGAAIPAWPNEPESTKTQEHESNSSGAPDLKPTSANPQSARAYYEELRKVGGFVQRFKAQEDNQWWRKGKKYRVLEGELYACLPDDTPEMLHFNFLTFRAYRLSTAKSASASPYVQDMTGTDMINGTLGMLETVKVHLPIKLDTFEELSATVYVTGIESMHDFYFRQGWTDQERVAVRFR